MIRQTISFRDVECNPIYLSKFISFEPSSLAFPSGVRLAIPVLSLVPHSSPDLPLPTSPLLSSLLEPIKVPRHLTHAAEYAVGEGEEVLWGVELDHYKRQGTHVRGSIGKHESCVELSYLRQHRVPGSYHNLHHHKRKFARQLKGWNVRGGDGKRERRTNDSPQSMRDGDEHAFFEFFADRFLYPTPICAA